MESTQAPHCALKKSQIWAHKLAKQRAHGGALCAPFAAGSSRFGQEEIAKIHHFYGVRALFLQGCFCLQCHEAGKGFGGSGTPQIPPGTRAIAPQPSNSAGFQLQLSRPVLNFNIIINNKSIKKNNPREINEDGVGGVGTTPLKPAPEALGVPLLKGSLCAEGGLAL